MNSLICAAILFVMWKNIAIEHEYYQSEVRRRKITKKLIQNNVDCGVSNTVGGRGGPGQAFSSEQLKATHHYRLIAMSLTIQSVRNTNCNFLSSLMQFSSKLLFIECMRMAAVQLKMACLKMCEKECFRARRT